MADGLLNYWNFEGNFEDTAGNADGSASTTADDGTPSDEFLVTIQPDGLIGSYGSFAQAHVEVPDSADINLPGQSLSISAWFRVTGFNESWQALIAHGEGSNYRIARNGDNTNMAYAGGTGDITGGPAVDDNEWHHIVAISEAGVSTRMWVDGSLVATGGAPTIADTGTGRLMIGGNPGTGSPYRPWNGDIDDVGMWNRPLTPEEIGLIYDQGRLGNALSTLFVPPVLPVFKTATLTGNVISATFEDSPTGSVDVTKTRSMLVDGVPVSPTTISKAGAVTTVSYIIPAAYPPGSDHAVTTTVTSSTNQPITGTRTVRAAFASVIDGPGRWKTEMVWTRSNPQLNDAAGTETAVEDLNNDYPEDDKITVRTEYIHFHDNSAPAIFADLSKPFPLFDPDNSKPDGTGFGDREDFGIRCTEQIKVTIPGKYWFNCNSDDGFAMWIDGEEIGSAGNRGRSDTLMPKVLTAGLHDVKFIYWERGGGAGVSVFVYKGISESQPPFTADSSEPLKAFGDDTDTDGDGMSDTYELANDLNPAVNDAGLDKDGDGLTNLEEFLLETRANLADTDGDGLSDKVETGTGIYVSPANTGTNPRNPDGDKDGLKDGVETNTGVYVSASNTGTNPFLADSDADGVDDPVELLYGTNPNSAGSKPPPSPLPLTDDFEDGLFDTVKWKKNLDILPATGGAVSESGGHLTLASRGYLVTREEYNPETTGGLTVSGEWTFATAGDDFLQIITRSDGLADPANCCGETQSGVEFFAFASDGSTDIRARNGDHAISNVTRTGSIFFSQGGTYVFTIIDDGAGNLSMELTDKADPLNTVLVTATLDFSSSTGNFIVFHNRESGRASQLENVRIEALGAASGFGITGWSYNATSGNFTLTWNSNPGQTFGVYYSTDMSGFLNDVSDSIPASAGSTTSLTFPNPQPGAPRLFFRVHRQ